MWHTDRGAPVSRNNVTWAPQRSHFNNDTLTRLYGLQHSRPNLFCDKGSQPQVKRAVPARKAVCKLASENTDPADHSDQN